MQHQEIMKLFDFVFESSKENVRKPDPKFYKLACKRGEVDPSEVIFLEFIFSIAESAEAESEIQDRDYPFESPSLPISTNPLLGCRQTPPLCWQTIPKFTCRPT